MLDMDRFLRYKIQFRSKSNRKATQGGTSLDETIDYIEVILTYCIVAVFTQERIMEIKTVEIMKLMQYIHDRTK
jgi:hypothetical protein